MSLLIFAYRKQDIIRRKNDLNFKLLALKQKLMDLQSYASTIADGSVSLNDLMKAPPSMFNRMSIFMMYSHQSAMAGAQQKYAMVSQTPGAIPQMQDPNMQQMYNNMVFKNLYDQEKEKTSKVEQKVLNEQDKRIQQETARIETQLKMLDAEEEKVSAAEDSAAKKSAPQYVA